MQIYIAIFSAHMPIYKEDWYIYCTFTSYCDALLHRFRCHLLFLPLHFLLKCLYKASKVVVTYLCVRGIEFASFRQCGVFLSIFCCNLIPMQYALFSMNSIIFKSYTRIDYDKAISKKEQAVWLTFALEMDLEDVRRKDWARMSKD